MTRLTLTFLVAQLSLVGGCAAVSDVCDDLCGVARDAYEVCQEEWGLSYGDPGTYESAGDYDNWCATWNIERRLLAETADDPEALDALLERCEEQQDSLLGGDCSTYHGTFTD